MENHKNRGMLLESIINKTISFYRKNDIALFEKKEIPIKFSKIERKESGLKVINGQIKNKSSVDYYGVHNGRFYAFEAKSTKEMKFPISNIKPHQIRYLKDVEKHGGISFVILLFKQSNEIFIIKNEIISSLNKKHISIKMAREMCIEVKLDYPGIIDFLSIL